MPRANEGESGEGEGQARAEPILQVDRLDAGYGEVQTLWDVSLEVRQGEIVALIGSNGAGKSTLLRTMSGLLRPRRGEIYLEGRAISSWPPEGIVRAGISHVPEGRRLFQGLTVRENLLLGAYARHDAGAVQQDLEWVLELFAPLRERQWQLAGDLSGGEQQMCAVGRGLMSRPKILLLDELSLGLAPVIVDSLVEVVRRVNEEGTTVLMVEQDVYVALGLATRGYVLETGRVVLHGAAADLLADPHVKRAYLGM